MVFKIASSTPHNETRSNLSVKKVFSMNEGQRGVYVGDKKDKKSNLVMGKKKVTSELAFWGKVNSHQISDSLSTVLHSSPAVQELMSQRVTH